jgi:hypothetical protein
LLPLPSPAPTGARRVDPAVSAVARDRRTWTKAQKYIAFPAILTAVFQFSIGFVSHLGSVELATVTVTRTSPRASPTASWLLIVKLSIEFDL